MYTVDAAYGVAKLHGSRWTDLDLDLIPVVEIFSTYRKVYLTLSAPFLPDPVYFDLDFFRIKYANFEGTLAEMFDDNGSDSIQTIESIPDADPKYAMFSDAFRASYKADIVAGNDLRLTRLNTNMEDVYKYCLFTVNGLFHMTDTDFNYVYVLKGGESSKKSRQNQLGIISFRDISEVKSIPITDAMLFKQHDTSTFSDRVYIKIPQPMQGKTPILMLGGYMVRPDKETFFPVGNDTYCVNVGRLPILQRYYESVNFIDYSSLGLDHSSTNGSQVDLEQFYSDACIQKYFTLSQSFIVVVDKENLFFNESYIDGSRLPNRFISYTKPTYPLFAATGKVCEYWVTKEDGQYSVVVGDSFLQNKVFASVVKDEPASVSSSNVPSSTHFNSRAYLLEIGCDF